MVNAYDPALGARFRAAAARLDLALPDGVYMWFSGPSFETPAEVRMAHLLGADLVGMSTVPEIILARRYGLRCAALSLVTNYGAGLFDGAPTHDETRRVAAQGSAHLIALLSETLREPLSESLA
jgi:purine-nucleoside phosphorylase